MFCSGSIYGNIKRQQYPVFTELLRGPDPECNYIQLISYLKANFKGICAQKWSILADCLAYFS